jgi:hypothetical protein
VVNDSKRRYRSSAWVAAAILGCVAVALIAQLANVRAADDSATASNPAPRRVKVLFLGDHGHHDPLLRLRQIYSTMGRRGIDFTYTDRVTDLNPETLNRYDELFLYANITTISPSQEKALLDFVESGHGFVPVHALGIHRRSSR